MKTKEIKTHQVVDSWNDNAKANWHSDINRKNEANAFLLKARVELLSLIQQKDATLNTPESILADYCKLKDIQWDDNFVCFAKERPVAKLDKASKEALLSQFKSMLATAGVISGDYVTIHAKINENLGTKALNKEVADFLKTAFPLAKTTKSVPAFSLDNIVL